MSTLRRRSRERRAASGPVAALLALGLLAGCGNSDSSDAGHDHSGGVAAATAQGVDSPYDGLFLADPYQKPSFTLTDTTGAPYDFAAQTQGVPTLLFFGYTNCPDVCPTTMADVATALRTVDAAVAERVRVVFVTTDPARDTPQALATFLGLFDSELPVPFVGLTGDQAQIDQAQLAAGVPQAEDMGQTHSALLLLYGPDGPAQVAFDAGNTARDIAHDLDIVAAP